MAAHSDHLSDDNVWSFCLLGPEGRLPNYLSNGNFAWLRVADKCDVPDDTCLVFNIVEDSAGHIAHACRLQQFVCGYRKDGEITVKYYQVNSNHPKQYDCIGTKTFAESQPDVDCLTMVADGQSITVPYEVFKLLCAQFNGIINRLKDTDQRYKARFERCLNESMDCTKTGKYRYENRALIYGRVF